MGIREEYWIDHLHDIPNQIYNLTNKGWESITNNEDEVAHQKMKINQTLIHNYLYK